MLTNFATVIYTAPPPPPAPRTQEQKEAVTINGRQYDINISKR